MLTTGWPKPTGGWPDWIDSVPYVAAAVPGATDTGRISGGANCQRYAYAVLALFGLAVPDLRSSELWTDESATRAVDAAKALDLVLFTSTADPYGAHVGVWMGPDQVLHLCHEVGWPTVWSLADFAARPRYAVLLGIKRTLAQPIHSRLANQ